MRDPNLIPILISAFSCVGTCVSAVLALFSLGLGLFTLQEVMSPNVKISLLDRTYSLRRRPPVLRLEVRNLGLRAVHDVRLEILPVGFSNRGLAKSRVHLLPGEEHLWDIGLDVLEILKSLGVARLSADGLLVEEPRDVDITLRLLGYVTVGWVRKRVVNDYRLHMGWKPSWGDLDWTTSLL